MLRPWRSPLSAVAQASDQAPILESRPAGKVQAVSPTLSAITAPSDRSNSRAVRINSFGASSNSSASGINWSVGSPSLHCAAPWRPSSRSGGIGSSRHDEAGAWSLAGDRAPRRFIKVLVRPIKSINFTNEGPGSIFRARFTRTVASMTTVFCGRRPPSMAPRARIAARRVIGGAGINGPIVGRSEGSKGSRPPPPAPRG
jgi:hypothetical protein